MSTPTQIADVIGLAIWALVFGIVALICVAAMSFSHGIAQGIFAAIGVSSACIGGLLIYRLRQGSRGQG